MYQQGTTGCRLYRGATPASPIAGMFSFTPCAAADSGRFFARPAITLPGLVDPARSRQAGTIGMRDRDAIAEQWHAVVRQVCDVGLGLGVGIQLPGPRAEALAKPA
jgi:hypothetical protein